MNRTPVGLLTAQLLARLEHTASPLPAPAAWPQSLRTAVDIVGHSPMPMMLLWGPSLCQLYNDAFALLAGSNHPHGFGMPTHEIWPQLREFTGPIYDAVLRGETRTYTEMGLELPYSKGLEHVWLDLTYSPIPDESGAVAGILITAIEANERLRAHAELQSRWDASAKAQEETEQRLQLALQATDAVGTWDWKILEDIFLADAHFAQLHSVDPSLAGHLPIDEYLKGVHPDDRSLVTGSMRRCIRKGGEYAEEYRLLRSDGSVNWVFARGRCYLNEDGRPARFLGAAINITERKRMEQTLRESEAHFRMAIELSPAVHWTVEGNGDRLDHEHPTRWDTLTRRDSHQPPGADWRDIVHPDDRQATLERWRQAVANRTAYEAEYRLCMADGDYQWMHARALPRIDDQGNVLQWFGMTENIDSRRRSDHALRELNENLEERVAERTYALAESNARLQEEMQERERAEDALRHAQKMEALGQLTGGIAHDFNNILTGIIGSLDLMQRYISAGRSGETGRFIDAAITSAHRAAALTHRLLAFSRRQSLDRKPLMVNQLIRSLEELFRRTNGEHIELQLALAEATWQVSTDASQLENALLNLVINARDAMPDGGVLRIHTANCQLDASTMAATLEPVTPGDYVMIEVSDNGSGMSAPILAKAFDPFFTTKPLGQGTGLGLSMIYGFAQQSGGQVTLQSTPGEGTRVRLFLPRHEQISETPIVEPSAPDAPRANAGESVLVVEDDPAVRSLVMEVLDELGYCAHPAADASEALPLLDSSLRVDLLVTDVGLPGINGRQLAEMAKARRPGLKILFMTGYAQVATDRAALLDNGMDMISKPFSMEGLANKIRDIINGSGITS